MKFALNIEKTDVIFLLVSLLLVGGIGVVVAVSGVSHSTSEINWNEDIPQICFSDGCRSNWPKEIAVAGNNVKPDNFPDVVECEIYDTATGTILIHTYRFRFLSKSILPITAYPDGIVYGYTYPSQVGPKGVSYDKNGDIVIEPPGFVCPDNILI